VIGMRLALIVVLSAAFCTVSPLAATPQTTMLVEQPSPSAAFVDAIGVNVHLTYRDTAYVTAYPRVRALLRASGIRHIRDALLDTPWRSYYERLVELARDGIHADLVTTLGQSMDLVSSYPERVPGAVESIEGPNEYDLGHGQDWPPRLTAFQRTLYTAVRSSPTSARYPVLAPALTSEAAHRAVGDLSAFADRGNIHDYFAGRNPGTRGWGATNGLGTYGALSYDLALARLVTADKAVISTETGYGSDPSLHGGVPLPIGVRYVLRVLFEQWNAGIERTYLYELVDNGHDDFAHHGLLDEHADPKPTYVAVKNLIAVLSAGKLNGRGAPYRYRLAADTEVHHTLLERTDGHVLLALWVEAPSWDPLLHTVVAVPAHQVTVGAPLAAGPLRQIVFEDSGEIATRARAISPDGSITIAVTDRLTILDLGVRRYADRSREPASASSSR
jgi:hypothetical protein